METMKIAGELYGKLYYQFVSSRVKYQNISPEKSKVEIFFFLKDYLFRYNQSNELGIPRSHVILDTLFHNSRGAVGSLYVFDSLYFIRFLYVPFLKKKSSIDVSVNTFNAGKQNLHYMFLTITYL